MLTIHLVCCPHAMSSPVGQFLPEGRNVLSCQVRANSKTSLNIYREDNLWSTAPSQAAQINEHRFGFLC